MDEQPGIGGGHWPARELSCPQAPSAEAKELNFRRAVDQSELKLRRPMPSPMSKRGLITPSDGSGQYSLPRFYQDRIIYTRSRQPWSVDVNGSNNVKLFVLPSNPGTPVE